jgi:hypothetical protein
MFEKLLSLFLHAKGGAIATVLVIGASGALVTATVENGVNTITITQPSTAGSQTTTGGSTTTNTTPNNTVTQTILALFNNTKKEGATEPAGGNDCSDAAHATNEQVKRVDAAFKTDHAAVQALAKTAPKTDAAKKLVKDANNKINGFRHAAVKAIHDLFKSDACKGADDKDKDEDKDVETEDEDDNGSTTGTTTGTTNGTTSTTTNTTTTVAISGTDAKALADAAIKAMDDEVANLKTKLAALPAATTTNTTKTDKAKADKSKTDNKSSTKGKSHSEGRANEHEDND